MPAMIFAPITWLELTCPWRSISRQPLIAITPSRWMISGELKIVKGRSTMNLL